uniref:Uncharacterized protein n=1 Tax=Ceratitis capitata TaxID=7213 RepID=W8B781_CERCA
MTHSISNSLLQVISLRGESSYVQSIDDDHDHSACSVNSECVKSRREYVGAKQLKILQQSTGEQGATCERRVALLYKDYEEPRNKKQQQQQIVCTGKTKVKAASCKLFSEYRASWLKALEDQVHVLVACFIVESERILRLLFRIEHKSTLLSIRQRLVRFGKLISSAKSSTSARVASALATNRKISCQLMQSIANNGEESVVVNIELPKMVENKADANKHSKIKESKQPKCAMLMSS